LSHLAARKKRNWLHGDGACSKSQDAQVHCARSQGRFPNGWRLIADG